jgi:hypothetical protein
MKSDCTGQLDFDAAALNGLLDPPVPEALRGMVGAYSSARFVAPCEVACVLASKSMVEMPHVRFVDSRPTSVRRSTHLPPSFSSLDLYLDRPAALENLTFMAFHRAYTIKPDERDKTTPSLGRVCGMFFNTCLCFGSYPTPVCAVDSIVPHAVPVACVRAACSVHVNCSCFPHPDPMLYLMFYQYTHSKSSSLHCIVPAHTL